MTTQPEPTEDPDGRPPRPDKTPPEWAGAWGPRTWLNQRACDSRQPSTGAEEFGLYSDVDVSGELADERLAPHSLFNALAFKTTTDLRVVLRIENHLGVGLRPVDWSERDDSTWVGMSIDEEYAALVSLALGRRFRSGGLTREFRQEADADVRGRPAWYFHRPLQAPRPAGTDALLPSALTGVSLADGLDLLSLYRHLDADQAVDLVRAARQYQLALWVCEEDGELAWLRLIGAIEVLAQALKVPRVDVVDRIRDYWPDLYRAVEPAGPDIVREVAKATAQHVKATQRFVRFLGDRMPPPPAVRPEYDALDWTDEELRAGFKVLYEHRSAALHAGKPWPGPLDRPGPSFGEVTGERPGAVAIGDSNWTVDDLPMAFHIFEYCVRYALQTWWREAPGATGP